MHICDRHVDKNTTTNGHLTIHSRILHYKSIPVDPNCVPKYALPSAVPRGKHRVLTEEDVAPTSFDAPPKEPPAIAEADITGSIGRKRVRPFREESFQARVHTDAACVDPETLARDRLAYETELARLTEEMEKLDDEYKKTKEKMEEAIKAGQKANFDLEFAYAAVHSLNAQLQESKNTLSALQTVIHCFGGENDVRQRVLFFSYKHNLENDAARLRKECNAFTGFAWGELANIVRAIETSYDRYTAGGDASLRNPVIDFHRGGPTAMDTDDAADCDGDGGGVSLGGRPPWGESWQDQLLAVFVYFKTAMKLRVLSSLLGISKNALHKTIILWTGWLSEWTGSVYCNPPVSMELNRAMTDPALFRDMGTRNLRYIIDCCCIRVQDERFNKESSRALHDQHHSMQAVKLLVVISTSFKLEFLSPAYGASKSDRNALSISPFWDALHPGECILVDRGFGDNIGALKNGNFIVCPARLHDGHQFPAESMQHTMMVGKHRILVEQFIACVREWNWFNFTVKFSQRDMVSRVFAIKGNLQNFRTPKGGQHHAWKSPNMFRSMYLGYETLLATL